MLGCEVGALLMSCGTAVAFITVGATDGEYVGLTVRIAGTFRNGAVGVGALVTTGMGAVTLAVGKDVG